MVIILDTFNFGLGKEPSGGVTFHIKEIEGLPTGTSIMLPVAKEMAEQLHQELGRILHGGIVPAGVGDLAKLKEQKGVQHD